MPRFEVINTNFFLTNEEWEIVSTKATKLKRFPFGPDGVPFSEVEYSIQLKRKPMFYVVNIVLPSTMLSFLCEYKWYNPSKKITFCSLKLNLCIYSIYTIDTQSLVVHLLFHAKKTSLYYNIS